MAVRKTLRVTVVYIVDEGVKRLKNLIEGKDRFLTTVRNDSIIVIGEKHSFSFVIQRSEMTKNLFKYHYKSKN